MALRIEHEIHQRRKGRNLGVGLILAGFVVLIMALSVVKLTHQAFEWPSYTQSPTSAGSNE